MIVYGDWQRTEATGRLLGSLAEDCTVLAGLGPGADRQRLATRLLVDAGELAQGLLDAGFEERGQDDWGPLQQLCADLTLEAARLWLHCTQETVDVQPTVRVLEALSRCGLPGAITVKVPEGYAFYALYPELYAEAAQEFSGTMSPQPYPSPQRGPLWSAAILAALDPFFAQPHRPKENIQSGEDHRTPKGSPSTSAGREEQQGPVVVVGVRSIGTSLAAVVAAVTRTGTPPLTLRPIGHPFRRTVQAGPRLEQLVFAQPRDARFAIVDEGPGLSGSSFGAIADWLEDGGVDPERIHFFPGHGGSPGPQASPRHRKRWQRAARHVVAFEDFLLRDEGASWWAEDTGTGGLALEDVAGGRWRARLYPSEESWPPANPPQERRKYLYRTQGRTWLARFAGLGRYGERKLARGLSLTRAGLIPSVCGLRHGFLVGEWLSSATPVLFAEAGERRDLIEAGARYLGFLAREFPAGADATGASPGALWEMARLNTQERFGPALAALLDRWREHLGAIAGRLRRLCTDNRMHVWEWLRLPDGRILKADALDHYQGHDCIGAQDLAWDVVGAAVEWDLDAAEQEALDRRLRDAAPYRPDPLVKDFYLPCYLAFQMGYYEMAAAGLAASQPEEAARLRAAAERYASRLQQVLIRAW